MLSTSKYINLSLQAFEELNEVSDKQISDFFKFFAENLCNENIKKEILKSNQKDIKIAKLENKSTTRLELTEKYLQEMINGLKYWQKMDLKRNQVIRRIENKGFDIEEIMSPFGVICFVFEARPNVFTDACGALKTGNTCIFRIGKDALNTAKAITSLAIKPALNKSKLPKDSIILIEKSDHKLIQNLLTDSRLGLAVIRGSGKTTKMLGDIARSHGINVSLHGTGGAWMMIDKEVNTNKLHQYVVNSLDRKVCNTLNTICVLEENATKVMPVILDALNAAGEKIGHGYKIHITKETKKHIPKNIDYDEIKKENLGKEWEWENIPEVSICVVKSINEGIKLFNEYSPHFVASLISENQKLHEYFLNKINAPFIGNGITRWVDGQYALNTPELGLSNWEYGRILGRSGILSGNSLFTIKLRMTQKDNNLQR